MLGSTPVCNFQGPDKEKETKQINCNESQKLFHQAIIHTDLLAQSESIQSNSNLTERSWV